MMPCSLHPKATMDPKDGCMGCWWLANPDDGNPSTFEPRTRECIGCLLSYVAVAPSQRYCSDACRGKHFNRKTYLSEWRKLDRGKEIRTCRICPTKFEVSKSNKHKIHCSRKCTEKAAYQRNYQPRIHAASSERSLHASKAAQARWHKNPEAMQVSQ